MNDLNPLPFCFMYGNCLGWTIYGYLCNDYFITTSNFPGAALGAFYMASVMHVCGYEVALLDNEIWTSSLEDGEGKVDSVAEKEERSRLRQTREQQFTTLTIFLWACPLMWGFLGTLSFTYFVPELGNRGTNTAMLIIGSMCGVFAMAYFASPLSTAYQVIKEGDASSLYPPMVIANIINCSCWVVYGYFAIEDPMVWGQNAAGLALQAFNLLLILTIPRTRANELEAKERRQANEMTSLEIEGLQVNVGGDPAKGAAP